MEKMIFSRKKSTFLLGGWDGGRFGEEVGKLRGGRGEAPLHFLAESFGGGRQRRHFQGCCTGGKKCVNLQVIVPGRFGARKMTQENILGDIRTRQNAQ